MADIKSSIKGIWLKGMEAIGNTASSIASNTKSKVDEMNLMNRRMEILKDFGSRAYALWQKGARFPDELEDQLSELKRVDELLNDLRAERLAGVKTDTAAAQKAEEEAAPAPEEAPEDPEEAMEIPEEPAEIPEEPAEIPETLQEAPPQADPSVPVIQVENPASGDKPVSGLSSAINDLFDQAPTAEEAAEKVNSALDSLEDGLKKFSGQLDEKLDELTDQIREGK